MILQRHLYRGFQNNPYLISQRVNGSQQIERILTNLHTRMMVRQQTERLKMNQLQALLKKFTTDI